MSKPQKYPGLYTRCKAAGISYQTMYLRCRAGMTVDQAFKSPLGKRRPHKRVLTPMPVRIQQFLWERADWNAAARADRPIKVRAARPKISYKNAGRVPDDTSPAHIRKLRAAYCDHFIKTGVLDELMLAQLRAYANGKTSPTDHAAHETTVSRQGPRRTSGGAANSARAGTRPQEQRATDGSGPGA